MSDWSDLHGEDGERVVMRPPNMSKNAKWCDLCGCWVEYSDAVRWTPDGTYTHFLCPGCDSELWDAEREDE